MFKAAVGEIKATPQLRIYKIRLFLASRKELSNPESDPILIADMWLESTGWTSLKRFGYKNFFLKSTRIDIEGKKITRADGRPIDAQNVEEMVQKAEEMFKAWSSNEKAH